MGDNMTTGERIKQARKRAGLTQKQLGEKLGITFQSVAQWETGKRIPKVESLQKIADALNMDVYTLMGARIETYEDGSQIVFDDNVTDEEKLNYHFDPESRLKTLLSLYNKLNSPGQDRVIQFAAALLSTEGYAKGDKGKAFVCHDDASEPTEDDYNEIPWELVNPKQT